MLKHIFENLFCGQPVALIHGKKEKRHHQPDHKKHRRRVADGAAGKEIHRQPHKSGQTETDKLAFRQVERQLGLNFR